LEQFCISDESNKCLYVLNKDYDFIDTILYNENYAGITVNSLISLKYSLINKKVYLLFISDSVVVIFDSNNGLKFEKKIKLNFDAFKMDIINDRIYIIDCKINHIYVFDLDMNIIANFGNRCLALSPDVFGLFHVCISYNKNYIFILDTHEAMSRLIVFKLNNFEYVGNIFFSGDFCKIMDNSALVDSKSGNLILCSFDTIHVFDLYFGEEKVIPDLIDDRYICKLNQHLYQNPYLLPCGNSACMDCIYDNFNIFTNKFKCSFESCHHEHFLKNNMQKDSKICNLFDKNIGENIKIMIDYGLKTCENNSKLTLRSCFL
jgi:hypothetical protein